MFQLLCEKEWPVEEFQTITDQWGLSSKKVPFRRFLIAIKFKLVAELTIISTNIMRFFNAVILAFLFFAFEILTYVALSCGKDQKIR